MTPRALFIVSTDGQGHQVRCRTLAAELTERGWGATLVNDYDGTSGSFDVVIVDDYKFSPDRYPAFSVPTVAIVDHAAADYPVSLLVNGCSGAKPEMYSRPKKVLAGSQYALLRESFRQFAWDGKPDVHFDARRLTNMDASSVAVHMAHAMVVVARPGMRALEAACVGAPLILAHEGPTHEENQQLNVHGLVLAGAAVECHDGLVGSMLSTLLRDDRRLAQMSAAGRKLVDGLGVKRVADAIVELVG